MHDLIIIGSGPAGLSAAVYGRRAGFSTLVIEKNPMSGGQVLNTYEVDNYLGLPGINGFDMGMKFREHAEKMQAEFMEADVLGVEDSEDCKLVKTAEGDFEARAVIIASGASHSHLGVPGEEELSGMGVSYCATCDGAFFRGQVTAVVGGGNTALEDAEFLSAYCEKVYVIHRRDELRGERWLEESLRKKENVEFVLNAVVTDIIGEGNVQGIRLKDTKTGESRELAISGLFVAIGQIPDNGSFASLVELDEGGYIRAQEDCRTTSDGVFAAGDCRTKAVRQLTTAAADGAVAGLAACEYINKNE